MTIEASQIFVSNFCAVLEGSDPTLTRITSNILENLSKYDLVLCIEVENLSQLLGPLFDSNRLTNVKLLRRDVIFLSMNQNAKTLKTASTRKLQTISGVALMQNL